MNQAPFFPGLKVVVWRLRDQLRIDAEDDALPPESGVPHDLRSPGAQLGGDDQQDPERKSCQR